MSASDRPIRAPDLHLRAWNEAGHVSQAQASERIEALLFGGVDMAADLRCKADLNRVFTPDAQSVAHARKVLDAFAAGDTGLLVVGGKLIEKPVLRSYARMVAVYERAREQGATGD